MGELGNGTETGSALAVPTSGISDGVLVSAANDHTCVTLSNTTAHCWGSNESGMLGDGTDAQHANTPVAVSGLTGLLGISRNAPSTAHSCVVLADTSAQCWGSNDYGQLGQDTWDLISSNIPVVVLNLSGVTQVSTGGAHSCATLADGTARCWGKNGSGELGDGTNADSYQPVLASGLSGVAAIAAGETHSCAVLSGGAVRCWGGNFDGQLGDDTHQASNVPVTVVGIDSAVDVALGNRHSCALLSNGTVTCWGDNSAGNLGNGTNISSKMPVLVSPW